MQGIECGGYDYYVEIVMAAKYFLNCRGVFQGGGCKVVAFIGAYRRALESGIGFTEFAGTSAGSIIAALAAAGATADELESFLFNMDLSALQSIGHGNIITRWFLRANLHVIKWFKGIKGIKPSRHSLFASIAIDHLGLYDSTFIKDNVDTFLRRKLGRNAEVRFSDLKYPLKIVAADLQDHCVKVWSNQQDSDFPVGKAVQCSCTFPFFFRPVDGRYIDGGVLSNLPIIFFPDKQGDIERTLAFSLVKDQNQPENNILLDYVASIVNTAIEGASRIQLLERKKTVIVPVETRLGLFDFGELKRESTKCRQSIQLGAHAMDGFLQEELKHFLESAEKNRNYFTNVEQIYNQIIFFSNWAKRNERIVISTKTLKWVWNLFVPLVYLRKKDAFIKVYVESSYNNGESKIIQDSRVRLLNHLGVDVHVITQGELPAYGFFYYRNSIWRGVAINVTTQIGKMIVTGKLLQANKVECKIVNGLVQAIEHASNQQLNAGITPVSFTINELNNLNKFAGLLKTKAVYSRATFRIDNLNIEELRFWTDSVHGYKYRSMQMLATITNGNLVYGPAEMELAGGKKSLMCPILVDEIEGNYYVIEGHVRLLYLYRNGERTANCVISRRSTRHIIEGFFSISDLKISDKNFELGTIVSMRPDRQTNKNSRGIESALRPPKKYLK